MQISWWTLAIQAVNFLLLVWLLWHFLFRPVRAVIEKRKRLAEEAFQAADAKQAEADAARQRFESQQADLAKERKELLKKVHEEMAAERDKMLAEARKSADDMMQSTRDALAEERAAAVADIRLRAADAAVELAGELLQSTGAQPSNDFLLDAIGERLAALSEPERQALRDDLKPKGTNLVVTTATALDEDQKARWSARLHALLGGESALKFVTEPALLAGIELHFPHTIIRLTWADQLDRARKLLGNDEAAR